MGNTTNWSLVLPVLALLVLCKATPAAAFGAGNIRAYDEWICYMQEKPD